ncbi:unnamed protein product [Mytilus coruscus]|uniref:Uncharacterized protein n=1 Tax=Mytilus coruscus TaxID=42192 RepID=A0A6J8AFY7_MYTCO|nr:unnamed protein product [Mytilus coruscus]
MNKLSIGSWNVNGLGDKYRDDQFMSCLKYDINILIETWKGVDDTSNIPDFKNFQKCRKKNRRSRRFSGGIIILYKSHIHKGIIEIKDLTSSKNRLWIKLDKNFFGLEKDLFVCATYITQLNSPHYDDDFLKLKTEITQVSDKEPSYLSDHAQIVVFLKGCISMQNMNIDRKYSEIDMTFKWETISKEKLNTVLEESSTRDEILGYENTPFEINCSAVERAEQQLNNIFKTLTMRSCKIIKSFRKKKLKKKKP